MGNSCRVFIAVILIISLFTVSVFATPTGSYDLYSTNGRNVNSYSASGNAYISNFSQHLAYIRVYLDQILSYNANISTTIDYYLPALLQRMVNAFSPAAGDTRSMWQLSSAMVSGITAIQSAALGIAQDVYNISGYTNDIQSKLTTLNSTEISSLAKLTNIDSNTDQIESQLTFVNSNLQSFESINWLTSNRIYFTYSNDNVTYYENLVDVPATKTLYIKFNNFDSKYTLSYLNFNNINLSGGQYFENEEFKFSFYISNTLINDPDVYFDYSYRTGKLFIYPITTFGSNVFVIKMESPYFYNFYSNSSIDYKYLEFDSLDFYVVDQFIQSHQNNDSSNLEDIKNILIDIDNNSDFIQNNNDLQINVDIDSSVGIGVTNVISKIQDLLDFGISLQEFLVVLNQFDNIQWFTRLKTYEQVNQDPRFSPGYIDLYD